MIIKLYDWRQIEKITVINEKGEEVQAEILACFDLKEFNKTYAVFSYDEPEKNNLSKIYISTVTEVEGRKVFTDVQTDEEWSEIKNKLREVAIAEEEE